MAAIICLVLGTDRSGVAHSRAAAVTIHLAMAVVHVANVVLLGGTLPGDNLAGCGVTATVALDNISVL